MRLECARDVVLFEVESRVVGWEEIARECQSKRDDVRVASPDRRVHSVLVLPPTRRHRELVAAHQHLVAAAFPARSAVLEEAPRSGQSDWPGDGLLWVAGRG